MPELTPVLTEMMGAVPPAVLFHQTFENVRCGVTVLDLDGRIRYANSACAALAGSTSAELMNRVFAGVVEPAAMTRLHLAKLIAGELERLQLEECFFKKKDCSLQVCVTASLLRDSNGDPHAVIAVVEEARVTRSSGGTGEALAEEQTRLLDAIPRLAWVCDPAGKMEFVNRHGRGLIGDGETEIAGRPELIHEEDRERAAEAFREAIHARQPLEIEYRMRHADGSYRWMQASIAPLLDAAGGVTHWLGIASDIHDQRIAEELLRRTERLAAAGRLAATVAHEINNPLEAVGNLIYLAAHERGIAATPKRYLQMANDELRRVSHIVSQTLSFYRESKMPQTLELSTLVNDVLSLYQRKLDAREIRVTRNLEQVFVEGIAGELRQVVANLLTNALDAMEPNGVLAMEVIAAREGARLSISDTGPGIEQGLLDHIFEPFFTTKKDTGTGLGLYVSKGIVERHEGRMEVVSSQREEDHGTAFVITLPQRGAMQRSA